VTVTDEHDGVRAEATEQAGAGEDLDDEAVVGIGGGPGGGHQRAASRSSRNRSSASGWVGVPPMSGLRVGASTHSPSMISRRGGILAKHDAEKLRPRPHFAAGFVGWQRWKNRIRADYAGPA
jgi:hypothetical protein